jgi:hypothetical protein
VQKDFPKSLLESLNENSFGGFILFNFNAEGDPQVMTKFDNQLNAMALQQYVNYWAEAMNSLNIECTIQNIADIGKKKRKKKE